MGPVTTSEHGVLYVPGDEDARQVVCVTWFQDRDRPAGERTGRCALDERPDWLDRDDLLFQPTTMTGRAASWAVPVRVTAVNRLRTGAARRPEGVYVAHLRVRDAASSPTSAVVPRPRYRVLAAPWYDHDHRATYPAGDGCVPDGYELTVYRVDRDRWDAAGRDRFYRPLGVTQTTGPWDLRHVRATVCGWLRLRAEPRHIVVVPADVAVYREVLE